MRWKTCMKHFFTLSCIHFQPFYAGRGSNFFLHQTDSLAHHENFLILTSASQAAPLGLTFSGFHRSKAASHICKRS